MTVPSTLLSQLLLCNQNTAQSIGTACVVNHNNHSGTATQMATWVHGDRSLPQTASHFQVTNKYRVVLSAPVSAPGPCFLNLSVDTPYGQGGCHFRCPGPGQMAKMLHVAKNTKRMNFNDYLILINRRQAVITKQLLGSATRGCHSRHWELVQTVQLATTGAKDTLWLRPKAFVKVIYPLMNSCTVKIRFFNNKNLLTESLVCHFSWKRWILLPLFNEGTDILLHDNVIQTYIILIFLPSLIKIITRHGVEW